MNFQPNNDSDQTVLAPAAASHNALMPGTRLGEFEILRVIGQGGFGIVYLAKDHSLGRDVALKEYMPAAFAGRQGDTQVTMLSQHYAETFQVGLHSFVNEAQLLARFDHPSLVKVYRFWEANGTGYMAMPYYDAPTLKQMLRQNHELLSSEEWLRNFLSHVLDALDVLHDKKCYHRDIAPDNIMMIDGSKPLLLDFGAARRVIGDMTQALTVILKPGYAPIEQYGDMPNMSQGPWTDLYALASVVYFIITEKVPPAALSRLVSDSLVPLSVSAQERYSAGFLKAIDAALGVRPEQRPQNVAGFRTLLGMAEPAPPPPPPPPSYSTQRAAPATPPHTRTRAHTPLVSDKKPLFAAVGGALIVLLAGTVWLWPHEAPPPPAPVARAAVALAPAVLPAAPPPVPVCPLQLPDGSAGCPTMVAVAGGTYRMGALAGDAGAAPEEMGATPTLVAPFEISAHEISNGQWQLCVTDGACPAVAGGASAESSKLPVVNVSWDASMAYIAWLSNKTKRAYRLPSELEWEYAARAGSAKTFPWGDKLGEDNAHCGQCGSHLDYRQPAPVGSFPAHAGLHDMVGNVYEWVSDCWRPSHVAVAAAAAAKQEAACTGKVQKGGAFDSMEADVRPAARTFGERTSADPRVGFRVSR